MPYTTLALYSTVRARLSDAADSRFDVFDGAVPTTPAGAYVVLFPDAGAALRGRLIGEHSLLRWDVRLICVGRSPQQCMNTVAIVRGLLAGWRPDPDRSVSPLNEQDNQASLLKDESNLQDIRYSFTLHYRIHTGRSI